MAILNIIHMNICCVHFDIYYLALCTSILNALLYLWDESNVFYMVTNTLPQILALELNLLLSIDLPINELHILIIKNNVI